MNVEVAASAVDQDVEEAVARRPWLQRYVLDPLLSREVLRR